ncbi:hypothetical protein BDD12DRAFT_910775 [Trichophaea hybrida]|nr:hypothetical protein BDD12DRAFT_910775 [Trichophaea hybrida]
MDGHPLPVHVLVLLSVEIVYSFYPPSPHSCAYKIPFRPVYTKARIPGIQVQLSVNTRKFVKRNTQSPFFLSNVYVLHQFV